MAASIYGFETLSEQSIYTDEDEPFGLRGRIDAEPYSSDFVGADDEFGIPISLEPIPTVPEPSALASLFALGALGLVSILKPRL